MTMGVYLIRHKPTGKVYVGSAFDVEARWKYHRKHEGNDSKALHNDWKHDGVDAFEFEIVQPWTDRATLYMAEQEWLDRYFVEQPGMVYNKLRKVQQHVAALGPHKYTPPTHGPWRVDSQKVKRARQRALHTLRSLSEVSGVSYPTIARIEEGHVKDAFPRTIRALADALGVKPVELMSEDKEVAP